MRKAFSLFTPLVGTAMIALAIALAVTMMQNDARISAGLTRSYEINGQELNAKLIMATSEVAIMESFSRQTAGVMGRENKFYCLESDPDNCKTLIKNKYESSIKINVINGIALDMITALRDTFGQDTLGNERITADEEGIKKYITEGPGNITINISGENIKEGLVKDLPKSIFYVNFTDDWGNKIQVAILPNGLTYQYPHPIEKYINETVELFVATSASDTTALDYAGDLATNVGGKMNCEKGSPIFNVFKSNDSTSSSVSVKAQFKLEGLDLMNFTVENGVDALTLVDSTIKKGECSCRGLTFRCAEI